VKSLQNLGIYLVAFIFLFISGPVFPTSFLPLLLISGGVIITAWASYSFRTTPFRVSPKLHEKATLIMSGPFAYVRHPMYVGVILVSLGLLLNLYTFPRLIALIVLVVYLIAKSEYEQEILEERFKEKFLNYKKSTKKLLPFIY
jgi:protein-S-isoprenylcysteine O-methyltransferase Ste14